MSGFFGIYNRNGETIDKNIANNMLEAMLTCDPDEYELWINGTLAFGHVMTWNTPESKFEHLPLHSHLKVLVSDARIDNRDELAIVLELPECPLDEIGDSEFILAAYEKWGEECPKHLLGDFTFTIWDEKYQKLFCARDHVGIKLFYFYFDDDYFIFGSDIEGLLAHNQVEKTLDDNSVAVFLKDEGYQEKNSTFFEKIKQLPAASTLIVTKSEMKKSRYWHVEKCPSVSFDTYDEYVEKLKELFDKAVEARIRSAFPLVSHLSGGIDSSPIAVLSARKLAQSSQKLYAYNWINIPKEDEYEEHAWSFSRRIAKLEPIIHKEFTIGPEYIAEQYQKHNFLTRGKLYYWEEYVVQDMAKEDSVRTILSGWGGDELISHEHANYSGYLYKKGNILASFIYLLNKRRLYRYPWKSLFKRIIFMILPNKVIDYINKFRNKKLQDVTKNKFDNNFFTDEFNTYIQKHISTKLPDFMNLREQQLALYNYGNIPNRIESWALSAFPKKIEYRYPLLDVRIIEFALGIPETMFYPQKGMSRHLIKNAVAHLLPEDIVWSQKVNQPKINEENLRRYIATFKVLQSMYVNEDIQFDNKYVDTEKIFKILKTFDFEKHGLDSLGNVGVGLLLMNAIKKL